MIIASMLLLAAASDPTVDRALAYLAKEVPRWQRENGCASCHNNGDGARALYAARRLGKQVRVSALLTTTEWLAHPVRWNSNRGNPAASDKNLARIQFAASLIEAFDAGSVKERLPLRQAATALLPDQQPDGSWQVDAAAAAGSPVTYGPYLATYMARRILQHADPKKFEAEIDRATAWLQSGNPTATVDRAAVLLAMPERASDPIDAQLPALFEAQNPDGGWGVDRHAPSEAFDTAIVLLALEAVKDRMPQAAAVIERGRECLRKSQLDTGDWPETTRPSGRQSYAQHVSTTAWATLALLAE